MADLNTIKQRLNQCDQKNPIVQAILKQLDTQNLKGQLSSDFVNELCHKFNITPIKLALHCIEIAACYALTPVSNFNVGAVAIGQSGTFYFGANQEFAHIAMQQTVHAEQSAISHAWIAGEKSITDIVVNHTPCGHCRQFMNELNSANSIQIHLPHSQNNLLHNYLPDDFGPHDLNVDKLLFDIQNLGIPENGDALQKAAIRAMNHSYAPYSQAYSGVAMQVGVEIICGKYAENAAFNPSFLPLQSALNYYRFSGIDNPIERIILCEKQAVLSHRQMTEMLAKSLGLEIEYIEV